MKLQQQLTGNVAPPNNHFRARTLRAGRITLLIMFATVCFLQCVGVAAAEEELTKLTCRVTGLFSADRTEDLKDVMREIPEAQLLDVQFATSEATFAFHPTKAFPGAKPAQYVERLDNRLRTVTRGTFGAKPVCTVTRDKLKFVEIPVLGLDCKGCDLGAYEAIFRLDGVEQATASFREARITAWIDPTKTKRETLIDALEKKRVPVRKE